MAAYELDDFDRSEFIRIIRKVDGMTGPGVVNTKNTLAIRGANPFGQSGNPIGATPLKITDTTDGRGKYVGVEGRFAATVTESSDFNFDGIEWSSEEVLIMNYPEAEGTAGSHRLSVGQRLDGFFAGVASDTGLRVFRFNSGRHAITDIRLKPSGDWVQATYVQAPAETDWENKIAVSTCGTTPTLQLMQLMVV